jgi:hypothetical protein
LKTPERRLVTKKIAPARSVRASGANHRESISACQTDDSLIANGDVTSKATDEAFRGIPALREGMRRAEITAQAGCAQCVLVIELS